MGRSGAWIPEFSPEKAASRAHGAYRGSGICTARLYQTIAGLSRRAPDLMSGQIKADTRHTHTHTTHTHTHTRMHTHTHTHAHTHVHTHTQHTHTHARTRTPRMHAHTPQTHAQHTHTHTPHACTDTHHTHARTTHATHTHSTQHTLYNIINMGKTKPVSAISAEHVYSLLFFT